MVAGVEVSVIATRPMPVNPAVDQEIVLPACCCDRSGIEGMSHAFEIGLMSPGFTGVRMTSSQAGSDVASGAVAAVPLDCAQSVIVCEPSVSIGPSYA